jgi:hypothetical protein
MSMSLVGGYVAMSKPLVAVLCFAEAALWHQWWIGDAP